ncbi:MAG: gamma carbonic anhydrase family protein [bacterium]|nr:gamma carbonic anhydrase family protein [bacterium]
MESGSESRPASRVRLGREVYIAPSAYIGGDVSLGDHCTVMAQVSIRGDVAPIRIGARCNIQDGAVIHCKHDCLQAIGDDVVIGHRAVVHGRRVGSRVLLGIGSIVLDDCEVGDDCVIAAGTVLPPGTVVPPGQVVMGLPGRVVRETTAEDRATILDIVARYQELGRRHARGDFLGQTETTHPSE